MKKMDLSPVIINPTTTPKGLPWNNVAHCLYHYHAVYCAVQGIARTNTRSRQVLLYLFKGMAAPENTSRGVRRARPIRIIHHAIANGRYTFAQGTLDVCFKRLFLLLDNHEDYSLFLVDGGKHTVPVGNIYSKHP